MDQPLRLKGYKHQTESKEHYSLPGCTAVLFGNFGNFVTNIHKKPVVSTRRARPVVNMYCTIHHYVTSYKKKQ